VRIALIAPPWLPVPPPLYGGTERVIDRLARGFVAAGHDVLLFTTGDSTCPVPRQWVLERSEGMRIGTAVPELRHVIHAYEAVRGFDVVHDHTVMGPAYSVRFPDQLVVTTNHGPFNTELLDIYRYISPRVPIIAISHDQASRAKDLSIAAVIHHGIDVDEFPVGTGSGGYFLFLGRMTPEKGPKVAIDVARAAGVELKLAAKMREPWEHRFFHDQVEPHLGDGIEFLGEVGGAEKLALIGEAVALLNPIRWPEPFGLVMVEALACGTPVLSFAEGAAPEIVDHGVTGFLCTDEQHMAEAISLTPTLDRAACRRAAESRFSTQRMVAGHVDLFERLIAGRQGPGR
jgi:glycosyltransferase involved in cell wall biosynthesis